MTRLFAAIVFLFAIFLPASADEIPAACTGKNLLEEMKKSSPQDAAAVLKEMAAEPNQGPLLWKIEKRGIKKPSWLMGTMHVTDTRVVTLSESVKTKIKNASVMVLELKEIQNKQALAAKMQSFTQAFNMPDDQTIWDVIPDDQEALLKSNPLIAMMPPGQIDHLQPWVVAQALNLPFCEQLRQPFKFSLDETLAQRAQLSGIAIEGLETPEEQIKVLSGIAMKDQAEGLVLLVQRKLPAEDIYFTMVELYLTRQVSALFPLMKRLPGVRDEMENEATKKFMFDLIEKRNVIMAERAQKYLDQGNAFIGVGAAHLAGKTGVVELLRKAGYIVTPAE